MSDERPRRKRRVVLRRYGVECFAHIIGARRSLSLSGHPWRPGRPFSLGVWFDPYDEDCQRSLSIGLLVASVGATWPLSPRASKRRDAKDAADYDAWQAERAEPLR